MDIDFRAGNQFFWSPRKRQIIYNEKIQASSVAAWSLLHELGHALLGHTTYSTDLELVEMESQAWQKAEELAKTYDQIIDPDHIQDCMDTYRDWLHQRSACPRCSSRSLQQDSKHYKCFNCGQTWTVSTSRFCRPYRMTKQTKTPSPLTKTTFV